MELILPGSETKRKLAEATLRSWLVDTIERDRQAGRKMTEFAVPGGEKQIRVVADSMIKRGIGVVLGSGNVFHIRWKNQYPIVIQSRPWASRIVRIK